MLKRLVLTSFALLAGCLDIDAAPAAKKAPETITGRIRKFECGDNCYLTIETSSGERTTGLCEAKQCVPWFENQSMPKKFIGKRIRVTTGVGKQFDGNYDVVGHTLSFKSMTFIK